MSKIKRNLSHKDIGHALKYMDGVDTRAATKERPLLLLFGWMLAKPRHLNKYGNMYISKGFDVITIQILIPTQIQKVVQNILDHLEQDPKTLRRPIVVHGLSFGGYVYGEMLFKLKNAPDRYYAIRKGLRGQIFDSVIDFDGIPKGFTAALTTNRTIRACVRNFLEAYFRIFEKSISCHYKRSSNTLKDNELQLPSLMVYSLSDPVFDPKVIETTGKQWRMRNVNSVTKYFEDSKHVGIFHKHPECYEETILKFLEDTGLEYTRDDECDKVERTMKI